jgi:ParB/RepB/Spo0J family partition protein
MPGSPPRIALIDVDRLHPDPRNRTDGSGDEDLPGLAATIRAFGVLEPLVVVDMPGRPGHYLIRAGHRRWRAAQMAGLSKVPCMPRHSASPVAGVDRAAVAVVENFQRAAMSPVETAQALGELIDSGMNQADIARLTGMSAATVSYHLELLDADDATLNRVRRGEVTAGAVHDAVKAARAAPAGQPVVLRDARPRRYAKSPGRSGPKAPLWFGAGHRLASLVAARCKTAGHPAAGRLGKIGCGECWEAEITAAARGPATEPEPGQRDPETVLAGLGLTPADLLPHVRDALFAGHSGAPPVVFTSNGQAR